MRPTGEGRPGEIFRRAVERRRGVFERGALTVLCRTREIKKSGNFRRRRRDIRGEAFKRSGTDGVILRMLRECSGIGEKKCAWSILRTFTAIFLFSSRAIEPSARSARPYQILIVQFSCFVNTLIKQQPEPWAWPLRNDAQIMRGNTIYEGNLPIMRNKKNHKEYKIRHLRKTAKFSVSSALIRCIAILRDKGARIVAVFL